MVDLTREEIALLRRLVSGSHAGYFRAQAERTADARRGSRRGRIHDRAVAHVAMLDGIVAKLDAAADALGPLPGLTG